VEKKASWFSWTRIKKNDLTLVAVSLGHRIPIGTRAPALSFEISSYGSRGQPFDRWSTWGTVLEIRGRKPPGRMGRSGRLNSTLHVSFSRERVKRTVSPTFSERINSATFSESPIGCPLISVIMSPPNKNSVPPIAIGNSPSWRPASGLGSFA